MKDLLTDIFLPKFLQAMGEVVPAEQRDCTDYIVNPVMLAAKGSGPIVGMSFFLLCPGIILNDHIAQPGIVPDPFADQEAITGVVGQAYRELRQQYWAEAAKTTAEVPHE